MTGDITIGTNQIPSSSLDAAIVLTNAAGQVVGADIDLTQNLPAVLTPGLRIAIQDDVPADQHADYRNHLRCPRLLAARRYTDPQDRSPDE